MTTITKPIKTACTASALTAPYMLMPVVTPTRNAIRAITTTLDVDIIVPQFNLRAPSHKYDDVAIVYR